SGPGLATQEAHDSQPGAAPCAFYATGAAALPPKHSGRSPKARDASSLDRAVAAVPERREARSPAPGPPPSAGRPSPNTGAHIQAESYGEPTPQTRPDRRLAPCEPAPVRTR